MAINFPNSPNPNDTHSSGGKTWIWDGTSWKLNSTTASGIALTDLSVTKPNPTPQGNGDVTYNNTTGVFTYTPPVVGGGGATNFTGLGDTPSSLTAGKWLKVNVGGTALEWTDAPSGNDTNDYVSGASLVAQTLVITRTGSQSLPNVSVDLSSLNSVPTTITVADESQDTECYPLFSKDPTGDIDPKTGTNIKFNSVSGQLEAGSFKKTGGTAAEFLKADGSIDTTTYLSSVALNDLSNVDATTNLANGKILKYDLGSTTWVVADDNASGGGSASFTGLSDTPSAHSNNKWLKSDGSALVWTDAPTDTDNNTTYDLTTDAVTGGGIIRLTASDGATDDVQVLGGTSITIQRSADHKITINSDITNLNSLSDVTISGSVPNDYILQYDTTDSKWKPESLPGGVTISNNADNRVITGGSGNNLNGEANLTFNGSTLAVTGDATISSNLTITGNLIVNGTTTTINSNTVNIGDNILVLNSDETGTPSQNGGLEIERGTSTNVSLRWNETTDKWQYTNDGTTFSDIGSSTTDTDTTYSISCVDGANSDEERIRLTAGGSGSGTDDIVLEAGTGLSIARSGDKITFANTSSNTTYDLRTESVSGGGIIRLENEITNTTDDVQILGGTNITVSRSADHKITINSDITNLNSLSDVTISGSIPNGYYLKYDTNDSQWKPDDPSNIGGTNNYASSLSFNTGNGVLTVNRSGLSAITVDLDGRYATGTIPTNNNQLTNGAGYITSSGTITNAEKSRIRTDTGNTYHNLVFVDSYSDNQFQVLKVDNASDSLAYNPSANRLIAQDLESFRMTSWGHDYGDSGQFLMSKGSSAWEWSSHIHQESNGEIRISGPSGASTNLEGGHLQFEDSSGNTSYAIDVYRNSVGADIVMRFIDQSQSKERFSIGPEGQWGIGHVGGRNFGQLGQVMISRGPNLSPAWGDHSGISGSSFASTAQGEKADTADADINNIYTQLVAIGNDDTITTVAQIKTALLALVRN